MIVLLSVQFYKDVIPVFTEGDSFMKKDFIIATKKVSTLGTFTNKSNAFSPEEIADLKKQSFTKRRCFHSFTIQSFGRFRNARSRYQPLN